MKILLVEDDDTLITVLTRSLRMHNYVVDAVKDGEMGWSYGSTFEYDVIVLDIVLPRLDGISLCKRFRSEGFTTPILLLTAEDTSTTKVQGLDVGADDYVVKPFDQAELVARIRALLRRSSTNPFPLLTWGNLLLNPSTCEVSYDGHPLTLTTKEYEFLELLLRDSQHVFSTEEVLDRLWSSEEFPSEATVRSHIRRVRQKLTNAGAPQDFIATLHGRGYYLKAPEERAVFSETFSPSPASDASNPGHYSEAETSPTLALPTESKEQQYLAFLHETWGTTRPKSLEQIDQLIDLTTRLQSAPLTDAEHHQAQQIAHKLAGTLSIFGLEQAIHLARQLENWFASPEPPQPRQADLARTLVMALHQEVTDTTTISSIRRPGERAPYAFPVESPLLLLAGFETEAVQQLLTLAQNRGLRTAVASTPAEVTPWLSPEALPERVDQRPDGLLLCLPSGAGDTDQPGTPELWLSLLQDFAHHYPDLPIVVLGDRSPTGTPAQDQFATRLAVVRRGGHLFLPASTPPAQVISEILACTGRVEVPAKVMIVDDDRDWLQTLPTLLKPWGFKVTTLDDPKQFWLLLEAITPDVLVLDVNMPQINGFELCQVLRSAPQWRRLPVLFLSVLTDIKSQSQAFSAGADDYLCKPVMGIDLANRILTRLQRLRAWAS
jgi:DNA-binding response OmpR family regulator/HPt (histidine-containing phosphotransfer) domain-containing protein